ncbi:MAG: HIT family protein [bacterium]|nr:HIT family protein [bacterium]
MYNHEPDNYICPICVAIDGIEDDRTMIRKSDIVYQDDLVTVFIGSFFVANNPGHPIIVPNKHYENLYDLPDPEAHQIISISRLIAKALKMSHSCDGVMIQQNNEPASSQHAFHYHMHIFPRYDGDDFIKNIGTSRKSTPEERLPYADKLRAAIKGVRG